MKEPIIIEDDDDENVNGNTNVQNGKVEENIKN